MQTAADHEQKRGPRGAWLRLTPVDVKLYAICDTITGPLLLFMIVFSPWAFGTTQRWAILAMNALGYVVGALWLVKWFVRRMKGYQAPRWGEPGTLGRLTPRHIRSVLGFITLAILVYCLISAINARSTFDPESLTFDYHEHLGWLPHSFDGKGTWSAFWMYLGLAGGFWSVQDWIVGKTRSEQRCEARGQAVPGPLPARMRLVLWVLAINGGLLAIEGIIQRLEGSGNLLFLIKPRVNPGAETQFGPYAYRANASQYFNLVWPVCLGFWWMLQRSWGKHRFAQHWILAAATLMAACPIISTSRGGAVISVVIGTLAALYLLAAYAISAARGRGVGKSAAAAIAVFFFGFVAVGLGLGWKQLKPRMDEFEAGYDLREKMFDTARPMARDYPLYGTGPGTFECTFMLYRITTDTYWPAQLHNDWLETRITFGIAGMSLLLAALGMVIVRGFLPGGIYAGRRFVPMIWLALAGSLVHARYDFPFQIHSLVFLTLLLCAFLLQLSRKT